MGIDPRHPAILDAYRNGLIDPPSPAADEKPAPADLVGELFAVVAGCPVWVLPVVTVSESNCRDDWAKKSNRTRVARRVVSRAFGRRLDALPPFALAYHAGRTITVVLTRLGGRKLDAANLPSALKATEDAVALMLGADDGDDRWRAEFRQECGGRTGVRIELRFPPAEDVRCA